MNTVIPMHPSRWVSLKQAPTQFGKCGHGECDCAKPLNSEERPSTSVQKASKDPIHYLQNTLQSLLGILGLRFIGQLAFTPALEQFTAFKTQQQKEQQQATETLAQEAESEFAKKVLFLEGKLNRLTEGLKFNNAQFGKEFQEYLPQLSRGKQAGVLLGCAASLGSIGLLVVAGWNLLNLAFAKND